MVKRSKKINFCNCGSGLKYKECCIFREKRKTNLSTAEGLDKLKHFGSKLRNHNGQEKEEK